MLAYFTYGLGNPLASLTISIIMLWLAWRGRREGDHPICRKCGYDLFGSPPASERCSSCGAKLSRRRAIQMGMRKRHWKHVSPALVALVACGLWSGIAVWKRAQQEDVSRIKPVWWLARESRSSNVAIRNAAVAEILRRQQE